MSIRALYCGGVVKNGIVAWGNHIPVTHRETFLNFEFQLKVMFGFECFWSVLTLRMSSPKRQFTAGGNGKIAT